jgi:TolB-like protein/Flp pilus assembly protein TadD
VVVVAVALAVWTMRDGGPDTGPSLDTQDSRGRVAATRVPAATSKSGKTMIAVLPFQNLGDPGDEYFADGMTEEITSRLAAVRDLGVISRTSAMQYKGTNKSLQEIGEELGVDYVLEGTVRWSKSGEADRVRITPQLITVADDTHLWSDRYDRTLEDIFAVQSEIAQNIVRELGVSLVEGEQAQIEERPTDDMQAYQAYLRGVDMWRSTQYLERELETMIEVFDEAVRLDPEFTDALQYLTRVHSAMAHFGYDRSEQRMALAKGYAQRTLEVAPESYLGHLALGTYYYWCRKDYEHALEELDRAAELHPALPDVISTRAYVKRRLGLFREAIADMERVIELDPRDHNIAQETGDTYMCLRDFGTAGTYFRRAIELAPNNALVYWYSMVLGIVQGDLTSSRKAFERMPDHEVLTPETRLWIEYLERDIDNVRRTESTMGDGAITAPTIYTPYPALRARLSFALGNAEAARSAFAVVRDHLRRAIEERPRDARLYAELCVAEAGLGNRADADAARARCLEVADPDVYGDPAYYEKFFTADVLLGNHDEALDRLDALLSRPSELFHPGYFTLEPVCDPLRDDPRFGEILARHDGERF